MHRSIDIVFSVFTGFLLLLPICMIALAVKLTSHGPILYWSDRIGRNNRVFRMPKFRTMRTDTPEVATHLLEDPDRWMTPIGRFLRTTSLDELPQLWSVFVGAMSLVGPRPALFNQSDLIAHRTQRGVHRIRPGLTGWAQVNGRDELEIPVKVSCDEFYLQNRSLRFDVRILFLTIVRVLRKDGVREALADSQTEHNATQNTAASALTHTPESTPAASARRAA